MRKRKNPNTWFQRARKVADDITASDWLKGALFEAINLDPTIAAREAEVLTRILQQRVDAVQRRTVPNGQKGARLGNLLTV